MNREWSEMNKRMQSLLKKETFAEAINGLLLLRDTLMQEMISWRELPHEAFCARPYPHADGYHSKTVAYSLWHIFRIEDIVVHSLILQGEQVLFSGDYVRRINAPIITTGNELKGKELEVLSEALNIDALYQYITEVREATDNWLRKLDYPALKTRFTETDRQRLQDLRTVSEDEDAAWLIDYWCGKDIKGLIRMPLSRHWIMHTEAALRIISGLKPEAKNGR